MIQHAIGHVVSELNSYLELLSPSLDSSRVKAANLTNLDGTANADANDKIVLSLVNVEEDPVYHNVDVYRRNPDGSSEFIRPEVKVNLYLLFSANQENFDESLKSIANIISFFQRHSIINFADIPQLADREGRLSFELYTLSFEQLNHLWGAIGAKYVPSVMYKLGLIDIRDTQVEAVVKPVLEIRVSD